MLRHKAKEVFPERITGYSQFWYTSPPTFKASPEEKRSGLEGLCEDGIPFNGNLERGFFEPKLRAQMKGLQFAASGQRYEKFKFHPIAIGNYAHEAYLLNSSIVVVSTHEDVKSKKQTITTVSPFPKYILTIMAQTFEHMKMTAEALKLPTGQLKELYDNVRDIRD